MEGDNGVEISCTILKETPLPFSPSVEKMRTSTIRASGSTREGDRGGRSEIVGDNGGKGS